MVGAAIGIGMANNLSQCVRVGVALGCIAAVLPVIGHIVQNNNACYVDISATGMISMIIGDSARAPTTGGSPRLRRAYTLLPSSTLWSSLMILNLQAECGAVRSVMVLPDTLSKDQFRALSVACRWIAVHNLGTEGEKA